MLDRTPAIDALDATDLTQERGAADIGGSTPDAGGMDTLDVAPLDTAPDDVGVDVRALEDADLPQPALRIVSGAWNACMILADNSLWCWGAGRWGTIGNGTSDDWWSPTLVLGEGVQDVSVRTTACALGMSGEVFCWGDNSTGSASGIGRVDEDPANPWIVSRPWRIEGIPHARAVATDGDWSCMIADDRVVWCWGGYFLPTIPHPQPFADLRNAVKLSMSGGGNCALLSDGRVRCWGASSLLPCGSRSAHGCSFSLNYVDDISDAVDVTTGYQMGCVIRRDRSVWCWGMNGKRQLGAPSSDICECRGLSETAMIPCAWSPQRVPLPGPVRQVDLADDYDRACALLMDGTVWCWGQDMSQPEGTAVDIACGAACIHGSGLPCRAGPTQVYGVTDAVEIAVGSFACIRRASGDVRCWRGGAAPSTSPTRWY